MWNTWFWILLSAALYFSSISCKKEGKDKSKKAVNIYEVKPSELDYLIESNEEILVLFYSGIGINHK